MICSASYTPEWIKEKRKTYPKSDPAIMEKVIYALALVEQLAAAALNFTFKGGTSLLLILPEPKRFSIDIVTTESREKIELTLKDICRIGTFSGFALDAPRSYRPGIPKAHYLLTFYSQWDKKEKVILLDILYDHHGYPALINAPIANEWIETDNFPICVQIPTVESITGDKLTAFAPNTIGIRYGHNKQMEIMKQLFDLGILFDRLLVLAPFCQSFEKIAAKEISYRIHESITREAVLNDLINTSLMIACAGKYFDVGNHYAEIDMGLRQLRSYIYNGVFRIDEAILASAKASYLAAILLSGYKGDIAKWDEGDNISNYFITPIDYQFLNKRRNIPGGPLFYWNKTLKLLGKV
jgi:hypothetical protein